MLQLFCSLLETGQGRSVLVSQGQQVSQGPRTFLTRLLTAVPAEAASDHAQTLAPFVCFSPLAVSAGFLLDNTDVALGKQGEVTLCL